MTISSSINSVEQYLHLNSPIHLWDPRYKVIGIGSLMFAFATVQSQQLLPWMILVTASFYLLSRLPLRFWISRLRYPGFFLVSVIGLLPFVSGKALLWQWGILTVYQEGSFSALLISCRFICIFTLSLIVLGTTPFLTLVKAIGSLGLPRILLDMMLLTYRYLHDIGQDLHTMQRAMHLRGFHFSQFRDLWHGKPLFRLASLVGTLLIRSYEQSERVYQAMRLRGYGQSQLVGSKQPSGSLWDWSTLIGVLLLAIGFVGVEVVLHFQP